MWVSIRYDTFRESEPRNEVFQVFKGDSSSIDILFTWDKFSSFRASLVNLGEDAVKSLGWGEIGNQVHGDILEWALFYGYVKLL